MTDIRHYDFVPTAQAMYRELFNNNIFYFAPIDEPNTKLDLTDQRIDETLITLTEAIVNGLIIHINDHLPPPSLKVQLPNVPEIVAPVEHEWILPSSLGFIDVKTTAPQQTDVTPMDDLVI
jgi:hypothetical protein